MSLNRARFKPEARHFGFKNPHGIYHLPYIHNLYPEARVINVVRDPRGILASEKTRRGLSRADQSASLINTVALRFRNMARAHADARDNPRYLCVRYSDLIANFEATIRVVLDFLGVTYDPAVVAYDRYANEQALTPVQELGLHARTLERPDPARIHAFRESLTRREQVVIESLCGREMHELLGLEPEFSPSEHRLSRIWFGTRLVAEKLTRRNPH